MNFFKLYIGDYQRDTGALSLLEHGAYMVMLQHFYATEKPLPVGRELYRLLRCETKADRQAVDSVVDKFWQIVDDGLINLRSQEEIAKAEHQRTVNREIGKRGGRPKTTEKITDSVSDSVSESKPNHNPNQTPDTRQKNPVDTGERTPSSPAGRHTSATLSLVPPDFRPDSVGIHKAGQAGIGPERLDNEVSAFVDHYRATGETRADWQAQWRKWCVKSTNFTPRSGAPPPASKSASRAHAYAVLTGKDHEPDRQPERTIDTVAHRVD